MKVGNAGITGTGVVRDKDGNIKQHFVLTSDPIKPDNEETTESSEEKDDDSNTPNSDS